MTKEEIIDWLCRLRSDIFYLDFSVDVTRSLDRKMKYNEVLSETIEELEQESMPMTEIDLYSIINQEYIEREVIDKIRAEIENDWQLKKYPSSPFSCGLRRAIEIIDKHNERSTK